MCWPDEWPGNPDGNPYNGKQLLHLVRTGISPSHSLWDVKLLIREIEGNLHTQVTDILMVDKGTNNDGFHLSASNKPDMVAFLAHGDVKIPVEKQAMEARFEVAVYELLRPELDIRAAHLLHHRIPVQYPGLRLSVPRDLTSRYLFVVERAEGVNNGWEELNTKSKLVLLTQLAHMRAALFRYDPPLDFAARYLLDRLFEFKPESISIPVAPTREFWIQVLQSKIKETIRNEVDTIGWKDTQETVGPIALAAKQTLLRAIPHIMPPERTEMSLYRLVLDHGDFATHNTLITSNANGEPLVTSLYDWDSAWIAPALLSDPLVAAGPVDLITDEDGRPCVTRLPENLTPIDLESYTEWARLYIQELYNAAPDYEVAIKAGKDVRYLWFALRNWRGGDSEMFFGGLGEWAEKRMMELGVN